MTTTLKFPQDFLRFVYWIFFKPFTFERYTDGFDISRTNRTRFRAIVQGGEEYSALRHLVALSLTAVLLFPFINNTIVGLLITRFVGDFDWAGSIPGVLIAVGVCVLFCIGGGFLFGATWGVLSGSAGAVLGSYTAIFIFGVSPETVGYAAWVTGLSFAGAMNFGAAFYQGRGLWVGVAVGIIFSVLASVIGGMSFGFWIIGVYFATYFRLPVYVVETLFNICLSIFADFEPTKKVDCLRLSPQYYDEMIWLPLMRLDTLLIAIGKHDRQAAQRAIADVNRSFRQQWAARNALIELTAYDIERAQNAQAIANIAEQFAWLPPTMPKDLENVLPPIRDIAVYAQAALESDTLDNKQSQLRNAIAQTQRVREGLALSNNRQIAARFGRALETWEQVLGKELSGLNAREVIPNVYVAGSPLATASKVFKGRHDLFVALERELASQAEQRPTLLLFGARRSGKTSAIKQMPVRLGPDVIPVEVDLQSAATAEDVSGLLSVVADQIKRNALTHRRVQLPVLTRDDLRADPYVVFRDWLNRVEEAVGTRWILLNLDEYERLTEMMEAGRIDQRVFDFLRGIIQHHPHVTVLLSGSHTLEDLPPIWNDYLINVRVLKIENLKEDEARELIVKPIEEFPLEYEPAAVDRIIATTGCQPFLLQATCCDLVNLLNEENHTTATLADADRALDSVLTTGVAYFQELWAGRDTDDAQRAVMRAVATQKDVGAIHESPLQAALRKLVHRDILAATDGAYHFRVELVRRWVERNVS